LDNRNTCSLGATAMLEILAADPQATAIFVSRELHIGLINGAMMKLWNKETAVIDQTLEDAAPEFNAFIPVMQSVWDTGQTYTATETYANIDVNGLLRSTPFDFEYRPMIDAEGKTYAILHRASDATERIRSAEAALAKQAYERDTRLLLRDANVEIQVANEQISLLKKEIHDSAEKLQQRMGEVWLLGRKLDKSQNYLSALQLELEESYKQLANTLEFAELGSYDLDLKTGLMECSDQCKIHFGVPPEARFDIADLIACILPEYQEFVERSFSLSIANHTGYEVEYQIRRPDSSIHWVKASGTPKYGSKGTPLRMVGVTQVITIK